MQNSSWKVIFLGGGNPMEPWNTLPLGTDGNKSTMVTEVLTAVTRFYPLRLEIQNKTRNNILHRIQKYDHYHNTVYVNYTFINESIWLSIEYYYSVTLNIPWNYVKVGSSVFKIFTQVLMSFTTVPKERGVQRIVALYI